MTRISLCSKRLWEGTHHMYIPKDKLILHRREMNEWCICGLFREHPLEASTDPGFLLLSHPHLFLAHGYDLHMTQDTCEPGLHSRIPVFMVWNMYQANESKSRSSSAMGSSGLGRWATGILISLLGKMELKLILGSSCLDDYSVKGLHSFLAWEMGVNDLDVFISKITFLLRMGCPLDNQEP